MDWFKRIQDLENITKIQCSNGNWDYDPYMMGLANGLILAHHMMTSAPEDMSSPDFKNSPKKWLKDMPSSGVPMEASAKEVVESLNGETSLSDCLKELVDVVGLENISNADDVVKGMNGINHRASWLIKRSDVDKFLNIVSKIVKRKNKYCVVSEKSGKNLGCSSTKEEAVKRLRQVEWFKHHK